MALVLEAPAARSETVCALDQEPNDAPETAQPVAGAFCVEGTISDADQEILLWTLDAAQAARPWSIAVAGPSGVQTRVQIHRLEEPGSAEQPAVVSGELWSIATADGANAVERPNVFLTPGTWLIGLSASAGDGGTYRIVAEPGDVPPAANADNVSPARAAPVSGGFETTGALTRQEAWYNWQLSGVDARKRWTLTAGAPLGAAVSFDLQTADGKPLLATTAIAEGRLQLPDIGLPAGVYRLHLKAADGHPHPFALQATSQGPRSPGREEEPNDTPFVARPLPPGQTSAGRISQAGDVDVYVLPEKLAGQLFSIELGGGSKAMKRLCVGGADGITAQCRESIAPTLVDIAVTARARFVTVSGTADPEQGYELVARPSGQASPEVEAEPNDAPDMAMTLAVPALRGRLSGEDVDVYRFEVADAELLNIAVAGDGVGAIEVTDAQSQSSARADRPEPGAEGTVPADLTLKDLALQPGQYYLSVSGRGGDYAIKTARTARPAGPAAARGMAEREPNDRAEDSQLLAAGEDVAATVSGSSDSDFYRLSLSDDAAIKVALRSPGSCPLAFGMSWDSWTGATVQAQAAGPEFIYPSFLRAGTYLISVRSDPACGENTVAYTLGYDAAPDLAMTGDVEPNDSFNLGHAPGPDLKVSGSVGEYRDDDWFRLPPAEADTVVTLTVTGDVYVDLTDGKATSSQQMALPTVLASGDEAAPITATVPAGVEAAIRVYVNANRSTTGTEKYDLSIAMEGRAPSPPTPAEPEIRSTATLKLETAAVAAFWHLGQWVDGTVVIANPGTTERRYTLAAGALPPGWRVELPPPATVAPGSSVTLPVRIEVEPDVYSAKALRVGIAVTDDAGATVSAATSLSATIGTEPVGSHLMFGLPPELLGGFNIAWTALGGELQPDGQVTADDGAANVNDGLGSALGVIVDAGRLPVNFTLRFGGGKRWPVRGITINPQTIGLWPTEYVRDFELQLSEDGETFETALTGRVGTAPREQVFLLPQSRIAVAARLRILSNHDGNLGRTGLSEWKVIADPTQGIGAGIDIADIGRGGHVVWSEPLISAEPPVLKDMLAAGGRGTVVNVPEGVTPAFVIGFNENRAAQISSIAWTNAEPEELAQFMPRVTVEASVDSPLGPWTMLGELAPAAAGTYEAKFPEPRWARFLRFAATTPAPVGGTTIQYPTGLRVIERAADVSYRSILGEWGKYSPVGFYETTLPPPADAAPEAADNDSRAQAQPLELSRWVTGRVEIGEDEDWFSVRQPEGLDRLVITIAGEPTVGAEVELLDESGKIVPLSEGPGSPRAQDFAARVVPGRSYLIRVSQPPHSVVIAYDTSGSLLAFIPIIFNALDVFARGVTAGREAVSFLPFDREPMLRDFSDQSAVLLQALAKDARESTTSGLESSTLTALRDLARRRGTRALLVVTDAASSTTAAHSEMWAAVAQTQARIFAAHTGSFDDPLREKQLLQDMAMANGGHYASARSDAELDVAFDRVAAWLRRPAGYRLKAEAEKSEPPLPGALQVTATAVSVTNTETGVTETTQPVVEIVLDASGSMLKRMGAKRRIEIARQSLARLAGDELTAGDLTALRVFGNDQPGSCETSLMIPVQPLDPQYFISSVEGIVPQNLAKTPIAASLRMVGEDLAGTPGRKTVILLTDGEETCGGDPRAEIAALAERDVEVRVNIVGFAVEDAALKTEFAEWARIGRGRYIDAAKPEDLDAALKQAAALAYTVRDAAGLVAASGTVGGGSVTLPAGSYRVEIATVPPRVYEGVVVKEGVTTSFDAGSI